MSFKDKFPDFVAIEKHIQRAQAQRSVAVAHAIANFTLSVGRGLRKMGDLMGRGLAAERDRRAIEADSFLKRSVPKY
jgi:hypothetical protein